MAHRAANYECAGRAAYARQHDGGPGYIRVYANRLLLTNCCVGTVAASRTRAPERRSGGSRPPRGSRRPKPNRPDVLRTPQHVGPYWQNCRLRPTVSARRRWGSRTPAFALRRTLAIHESARPYIRPRAIVLPRRRSPARVPDGTKRFAAQRRSSSTRRSNRRCRAFIGRVVRVRSRGTDRVHQSARLA